jgi:hypothetical protein
MNSLSFTIIQPLIKLWPLIYAGSSTSSGTGYSIGNQSLLDLKMFYGVKFEGNTISEFYK